MVWLYAHRFWAFHAPSAILALSTKIRSTSESHLSMARTINTYLADMHLCGRMNDTDLDVRPVMGQFEPARTPAVLVRGG